MSERRFPPPWTVEQQDTCFVVTDTAEANLRISHGPEPPVTFVTAPGRFRRALCHHRTQRAKGNDDGQDTCVGLRAGGCRYHAQGQA